jgi:hypothetical protein
VHGLAGSGDARRAGFQGMGEKVRAVTLIFDRSDSTRLQRDQVCFPMSRRTLTAAALLVASITQRAAAGAADRPIPACTQVHCAGKPIKDSLRVLEFCIPRGVKLRRHVGEHGDIHYTITARLQGKSYDLFITSGPYYSGKLPDWAPTAICAAWRSPEWKGEDCRIMEVTNRSRYVTLNTPMGSAEYRDVPPKIATRFDRILDSLCWNELRAAVGGR